MSKKILALLLAAAMVFALAACGSQTAAPPAASSGNSEPTQDTPAAKEPLRVAVQSFYCSSMAQYIQDSGLLDTLDYDVEWIVFTGGAPINEAMGEWDLAITGGAAVYALANYECKLVAHQVNGTDGNYIIARDNDPILNATTKEEQAALVRGKTVLCTFGQTGHYTANLWLESLGVDPAECDLVNLEVANVYNSWVAGEGDYAVVTEPYCYYDMNEINSTVFATLDSVGGSLFESTVCTKAAYENRYDDIVAFVQVLYKATDALSKDEDMAAESVSAWYEACGKTPTLEDAKTSLEGKPMISIEEAKTIKLGDFMNSYAAWFESRELIDATGLENVKNNIASDVFADALAGL